MAKSKASFKPHLMCPKNGKSVMAKTYEEHLKYKKWVGGIIAHLLKNKWEVQYKVVAVLTEWK